MLRRVKRMPYAPHDGSQETPFSHAKRVHNGITDQAFKREKAWRTVAMLALVLSGIGLVGMIRNSDTVRVYPYLIERLPNGEVSGLGMVTQGNLMQSPQHLGLIVRDWIIWCRSVSIDPDVVRRQLNKAWYYAGPTLARDSAFQAHLSSLGALASIPDTDSRREVIRVPEEQVVVIPMQGGKTYSVLWNEIRQRWQGGEAQKVSRWSATVTIAQLPWDPKGEITERQTLNPLGIQINDLTWKPIEQ